MAYGGVDLHKRYSYVARTSDEGEILAQERAEHNPKELEAFVGSLDRDDRIAVEATGNWYYFYELLEEKAPNISLAHPLKTRVIAEARVKTDKIDSTILAHLLRADLLPETHIGGLRFLQDIELRSCYRQAVDGYLRIIERLSVSLQEISHEIDQIAEINEQAQLLMSMPGIGCSTNILLGEGLMYLKTIGGLFSIFLTVSLIYTASASDVRTEIEITDLVIANSALSYEVAEDLQVGDKQYTDRDYTWIVLPDYLVGLKWIRTANDDKKNPDVEISFRIDVEAYVYILWIARDPAEQDWLQDNYTLLEGDEVGSTDEALKVFRSNEPFAAGEAKTYDANTIIGMYLIVLEATGGVQAVEPSNKLSVTWGKLKKS